eukprot:27486-Prymnesium_polylepis.1
MDHFLARLARSEAATQQARGSAGPGIIICCGGCTRPGRAAPHHQAGHQELCSVSGLCRTTGVGSRPLTW